MHPLSKTSISCIILAGGKGRRVGGEDKGLLLYQQRPLVEHVIQRLKPDITEFVISANRNISTYQKLGYVVVDDGANTLDNPLPHKQQNRQHAILFSGPLTGIDAALNFCSHAWVLVVPCDMPLLPSNLLTSFFKAMSLNKQNTPVCVAKADGYLQPVFLMPKKCHHSIKLALENNQARLMQWVSSQQPTVVEFPATDNFRNFNYTDDFSS